MGKMMIRWVAVLLLLTACASGRSQSSQVALEAQSLQPTFTPELAAVPATDAAPLATPSLPIPTPSQPLLPQFIEYREPRGVFTVNLPDVWNRQSFPEGIGVSATAYNATARYILSLSYSDPLLPPEDLQQLAETYQENVLDSYLVQEPAFTQAMLEDGFKISGEAILTGTPTVLEITVQQTEQGTIVLQSWLVPSELWPDFVPLYKQPIEQSLVIDESALQSLLE